MSRNAKSFWIVFVISVVIDQITKFLVYLNVAPATQTSRGEVITVIPGFFDIIHAQNPGAAFSILRDFEYRYLVFVGFTCVAVWVVWDQFRKLHVEDRLMSIALGLIASGAIGNAIDRVHKRTVTDFARIHIEQPEARRWLIENLGTNEYPTWNIADAALLIGVLLFLIVGTKAEAEAKAAAAARAAPPAPPAA